MHRKHCNILRVATVALALALVAVVGLPQEALAEFDEQIVWCNFLGGQWTLIADPWGGRAGGNFFSATCQRPQGTHCRECCFAGATR